jgi:5-methylcytosine-specific restriction endonuclease McrA
MNQAIAKVDEVYGIDVFEDSSITQSPNFRLKRKGELKIDYTWAFVALTGKRDKGKNVWKGIERLGRGTAQIGSFDYRFSLTRAGLFVGLANLSNKITETSNLRFIQFHQEFIDWIHTLSYYSGITPNFLDNTHPKPFSTFSTLFSQTLAGKSHIKFASQNTDFPITDLTLERTVKSFIYFFPIYDSYVQIAKGQEVRFYQLIDALNSWHRKQSELEKQGVMQIQHNSQSDILKFRELADQKIKVMPAMRWQVFQRDSWRCVSCGRNVAQDGVILHVDHITPRSKGGQDVLKNYQTLCHICNIGKSNRDDTDLRHKTKD